MTVCIAAICNERKSIVYVSDLMISTAVTSADAAIVKMTEPINDFWDVMFAGNDLSPVTAIVEQVRKELPFLETCTLERAVDIFTGAYQAALRRASSAKILSPYGLDTETFLKQGKSMFAAQEFSNLCSQISQFSFDCELLIAGYDDEGRPHIFTVTNPGVADYFDRPGYWAIGSGKYNAITSLVMGRLYWGTELPLATYRAYEAKLVAESALGVGKNTFICVHHQGQDRDYYADSDFSEIRGLWEKEGRPRLPKDAVSKVTKIISPPEKSA